MTAKTFIAIVLGAIAATTSPAATDTSRVNKPGEAVPQHFTIGGKTGDPVDHLPPNIRMISEFGERPVFSPDGRKIAFIGKSYGDAFEYVIATGEIRNLTAHMAHQGFLRIHYMRDGSYILTGPHVPAATREETRFAKSELWWMAAAANRPAVRLGVTLFEGVAVSRTSNHIAWAENDPAGMPTRADAPGTSKLKVGEVVVANGTARLANVREIAQSPFSSCMLEAQDFLPEDHSVTGTCYSLKTQSTILSVALADGAITRYPMPANLYNEVEGIFPDGKRTLVECSHDNTAGLEMCLLELKADRPRYTRLTRAMDYGNYRWSNPQVSGDGKYVAFQTARGSDEAGVGRGILLMTLPDGF